MYFIYIYIKKHTTHFGIFFGHSWYKCSYRVFSITNALQTDEKNRFLVETIKVLIVTNTLLRNICATTPKLQFQTSQNYFKKVIHLRSTRHLPTKIKQLLQHQLEINFKFIFCKY
jgi:hypothetical protein